MDGTVIMATTGKFPGTEAKSSKVRVRLNPTYTEHDKLRAQQIVTTTGVLQLATHTTTSIISLDTLSHSTYAQGL
jgi:hypothetical protein